MSASSVLRQRLVLVGGYPGGLWTCSWCAAELDNGVIAHRVDCGWITAVRQARP